MPNDVLIGLSDAKFWRGRDGEETPISEMSDAHLNDELWYLMRRGGDMQKIMLVRVPVLVFESGRLFKETWISQGCCFGMVYDAEWRVFDDTTERFEPW